jgi:hypothetical protein
VTSDLITVVTCTLGDSCAHLSRCLTELRQFTKLPFRQIVSDDGTAHPDVRRRQKEVCHAHGAEWTENPGPVFGISYNLNYVFEQVKTPWVFLIEDAVRPSWGWLETALDALERVGLRTWNGRPVAGIGLTTSFENWHLACAKVLPTDLGINDFFGKYSQACYDAFWGSANHPHWNDGYWCWARMEPKARATCFSDESETWPHIIKTSWRDPIRRGDVGGMKWTEKQFAWGWQATSGWPTTRGASWAFGPSAWGLHNLDLWRKAGRFRDGCTFYEGHLGVRYAKAGFLSINCECPPWHHWSGLAFRVRDGQREPRHHEPTDGPNGILERDFGCNGNDHADLADYTRRFFAPGELDEVNRQLQEVKLLAVPGWEKWE